ncbi:MAG TPA: PilN domain-containing protein [Candidatus Saccharimonadales bacterium]|nr:PilN domain-containing protein [Candidatus Saccharimonadales bacterium]
MEIFTHKKNPSIDLLQDEEKVKSASQKNLIFTICGFVVGLTLLVSLGVFLYQFILNSSIKSTQKEYAQKAVAWQVLEPVGSSLKAVIAKDQVLSATTTKYADVDKKIDQLRKLIPQNVTLTNFTIDNSGKITISGKAVAAANVYQFFDILNTQKGINLPTLTSLNKAGSSYTFTISLTMSAPK